MTLSSTLSTLPQMRRLARELLNEFDAADALACYYTLHHDPRRTTLHVHFDARSAPDGFLVHCYTGFDLFRPLITMRLRGLNNAAAEMIDIALLEGRPYLLVLPDALLERVQPHFVLSEVVRYAILRLDVSRFRPVINALVQTRQDREGNPRAEIRRGDEVAALAGVNWRSPIFAEVFVQVRPEHRGRGWGRAVTRAVVAELLQMGVTPLYTAAEDDDASLNLAEDVGFVSTGNYEIMAQAVRVPTPTLAAGASHEP